MAEIQVTDGTETAPVENEMKTLPSMPLLNPPSRPASPEALKVDEGQRNDPFSPSVGNEHDSPSPEKPTMLSPVKDPLYDSGFDYISMEDFDEPVRPNPIAVVDKRKSNQFPHAIPAKKRKKQDVLEMPEGFDEEPGTHYAEAYFTKVKSTLDESTFQKFIAVLSEAKDELGGATALYRKIEELFVDHPELAEDFVGTLRPDQALEIGKLLELKFITRSLSFFKKLEGFQLTKVIHALEGLASNADLNDELVKSTILSILKGHTPLAESFLHLLPNEKPPPPNSLDDYEDITDAMLEDGEDEGWETTRIPEHAERGCQSDCTCRCHAVTSQPFCLECNLRFIKGQAYVQYGKVVRYCKVHFGDMTHDEVLQRFNPALYSKRRRKRKSISKASAPTNESKGVQEVNEVLFLDDHANLSIEDVQRQALPGRVEDKAEEDDDYWEEDDVSSGDKSSGGDMYEELDRHSEDTEDRLIGQLNPPPLSPHRSTVKGFFINDNESAGHSPDAVRGVVIDVSDIRPNGVNTHVFQFETRVSDDPCIKTPSTPEDDQVDAVQELQNDHPIQSNANTDAVDVNASDVEEDSKTTVVKTEHQVEVVDPQADIDGPAEPNSVPHQVAETREIKTEPELQTENSCSKTKESDKEWTRQEDKMILEAFQREIGTEETFSRIRNLMPARSVDQIQERFQILMNLLEKVASGSHDSNPN